MNVRLILETWVDGYCRTGIQWEQCPHTLHAAWWTWWIGVHSGSWNPVYKLLGQGNRFHVGRGKGECGGSKIKSNTSQYDPEHPSTLKFML